MAERKYGKHIVQYPMEHSLCAGCTTCEIVCALTHDGVVSPSCNRVWLRRGTRSMIHTVLSCQQCEDHPCYDACPKKGAAMRINDDNVVVIDEAECVGCGSCMRHCAFDPPRINMVKSPDKQLRKAKKCDMCAGRPEGPACVQWCPVRCIGVSEESGGGESV